MNVPFQLADSALDKLFLEESFAAGLHALKGHRVVGGMRASHLQRHAAGRREGVNRLYAGLRTPPRLIACFFLPPPRPVCGVFILFV